MKGRIIIVGGGFAGVKAAMTLASQRSTRDKFTIELISDDSYLLFYPLLSKVVVGEIEPENVAVALRDILPKVKVIVGQLKDLDQVQQRLSYQETISHRLITKSYDHLILAIGSTSKIPPVEGLEHHAQRFGSMFDALRLRDQLCQSLESSLEASSGTGQSQRRCSIAIVGGGFTGCELAGEIQAYFSKASKDFDKLTERNFEVHLIEQQGSLLGAKRRALAEKSAQHLSKRGVQVHLNASLRRYSPANKRIDLSTGEKIRADIILWCAGVQAPELLKGLSLPCSEAGFLLTEPDFRVQGSDCIWSIGDCSVNQASPSGEVYAPTAQMADKMGKQVARHIGRYTQGKPIQAKKLKSAGMMLPLGFHYAVLQKGSRVYAGFSAWLIWCAFYSFRIPHLPKKIKVAIDLFFANIFGRDYISLHLANLQLKD